MKFTKKTILITTSVLMIFLLLVSGCGQKKSNALRVGVDDTYPPMEFRDDKNEIVGFDIDLAKEIGKKLGQEVEFVSINWDGIFPGLDTDKFDCIISSVSMTPDRLEKYEFTTPYLANGQVIVVRPGDQSIQKPEDLAGKKVGVQAATTADTALEKHNKVVSFNIEKYDEIIQTFSAMEVGRIDCIVVDYAVAIDYATKHPDKYVISSAQLTNEPISICIKKGNTDLKTKIQKALDEIKSEGKLSDISKKWLNEDYTQNIDTNLW